MEIQFVDEVEDMIVPGNQVLPLHVGSVQRISCVVTIIATSIQLHIMIHDNLESLMIW